MHYRGLAALAALLTLGMVPQAASADDFSSCDGYEAPGRKTDGMTNGAWLWGLATATADIRPDSVILGKSGSEACDRALANAALKSEFWLRRANLLQAKAVHALTIGYYDQAMEALGHSDEIGKADPYFVASLGLGNRAIRALALNGLGRKEEALAEIEAIEKARPWSASMLRLASQLKFEVDEAGGAEAMHAILPLAPENALMLYWQSFVLGDLEKAIGYVPAITWELPKKRGGWTISGELQHQLEMIEQRAELAGSHSFALAMLGRDAEAELVYREAIEDVVDVKAPPPDRGPGRPARKRDIEAWQNRLPFVLKAESSLDLWREATAFVRGVAAREPEEAFASYQSAPIARLPIFPSVLGSLNLVTAEEAAAREQALDEYRKGVESERRKLFVLSGLSGRELLNALPRHLTEKMMPVMKRAGDGFFLSDTGLSKAREGKSDVWTVRFVHKYAPIHVVEEMAMFGAALTALDQGQDSVLVLSRRSAELTTNVSGYYGGGSSYASGYEAQLRVQFVDSARLPPELAGMEWRAIPAKDIVDDLSARYRQSGGITIAW